MGLGFLLVLEMIVNLDPAVTKEICADCILKWLPSVVTDMYASAEGVALPEGKVHVHEMCTLASS